MFKGSGAYTEMDSNFIHTLICDEAHRLNEKSGLYGTDGENQVKEIINSSYCSVFFIDESQRVTLKDKNKLLWSRHIHTLHYDLPETDWLASTFLVARIPLL